MTDTDNVPPKPAEVTQTIIQMPGMEPGKQGTAGLDKPGPNVTVVAVPLHEFIMAEVSYFYVKAWLSVGSLWAVGQLADYGAPKTAVMHVFQDLAQISTCALVPTAIAVMGELAIYLQKRRKALGLADR